VHLFQLLTDMGVNLLYTAVHLAVHYCAYGVISLLYHCWHNSGGRS